MIYNTVLDAIGSTPLIRLGRMAEEGSAEILVKFEGSIIVEPTSGNQGIGLALVGAVLGYKTIIIMPDSVSEERRMLVRHYGAEVILIHDAGNIGKCIAECAETAMRMKAENPKVFVPQQFEYPANVWVQENMTAQEILADADGPIDGFCSGIGTGGTITGIGRALKKANPHLVIWAVEPEHAAILSGGSIGTHLQMGIGDGLIPQRRPDVWHLERDKCLCGEEAGAEARPRQARRHRPPRHRREILFNAAL